ncbi:isopentenyl-diphosphate delta-isomerase [Loktanella sp. D2R18]|uniref:isopentenyl-diphosphate delta-isomerase n=1 Tax=Rhodobacterales TaxID=204455 RepID=UPI000DE8F1D8|nr:MULTISPECIES: isopentenyl-diphosphate delta-isomerase [Rhodobacterales]MDO6591412.1 isopentenyl-diphosphate delta-isomerase [Yoonia sp. 1_MG-2023]RBW43520.1 isopentenyl-diphosphate delta-isomerase [Loktanella sp. D2R18]
MSKQMIPAWVDGGLTPVEKLEVHQKGLKHKAVSVFLMQGERVLIQQRALEKYHTPGMWANTCCTHPLWNETDDHCATRRLAQELGITGIPLTYRDTIEYRADVGDALIEHEVVAIFTGQTPAGLTFTPNPEEVMGTRWVSFDDLATDMARTPENYTPWLHIYLRDHAATILGGER